MNFRFNFVEFCEEIFVNSQKNGTPTVTINSRRVRSVCPDPRPLCLDFLHEDISYSTYCEECGGERLFRTYPEYVYCVCPSVCLSVCLLLDYNEKLITHGSV